MAENAQTKSFIFGMLMGILFSHSGLLGFASGAICATFILKNTNVNGDNGVLSSLQTAKGGIIDVINYLKIMLQTAVTNNN